MRIARIWLGAFVVACGGAGSPSSTTELRGEATASAAAQTGIVLFEPTTDGSDKLHWLDLASGATGELGYDTGKHELTGQREHVYTATRDALWFLDAGTSPEREHRGALRVARDGNRLATRFAPDIDVRGIAPDESRAAISTVPPNDMDFAHRPLVLADIGHGFANQESLGISLRVGNVKATVFGWRDGGVIADRLVGDRLELVRAAPGDAPRVLRSIASEDYVVSADTQTLAWIPLDPAHEKEQVLHVVPLGDTRAVPRKVRLGSADVANCVFAPDNRTLGCELYDQRDSGWVGAAIVVDVATLGTTQLAKELVGGPVFSPDGRFVIVGDDKLTIMRIDGTDRTKLAVAGVPVAWVR